MFEEDSWKTLTAHTIIQLIEYAEKIDQGSNQLIEAHQDQAHEECGGSSLHQPLWTREAENIKIT